MHMRRCTQRLPIFRHSSQPSICSGIAATSIWSRWLQMAPPADMPSPFSAFRGQECDGEIARRVRPPGLDPETRLDDLELEPFAAELRADLDSQEFALVERHLELESRNR